MTIFATMALMAAISGPDGSAKSGAELAMETLRSGNARYVSGQMHLEGFDSARRSKIAGGQHPHTIVLTCADSRVSPEIVFDQGLGDVFVIRVAGNVVDTYSMASIEYAAEHLGSSLLVVMGHERCGAVGAAVDVFKTHKEASAKSGHGGGHGVSHGSAHGGGHAGPHGVAVEEANIFALVGKIMPAVDEASHLGGDLLTRSIEKNVGMALDDCWTKSPMLKRMVIEGSFKMAGAVYDLDSGKVEFLPEASRSGGYVRVHSDH